MTLETEPFDAAPYFKNPKDQAELLSEAFETGEVGYITAALRTVAQARGMAQVAREAGLTREGLYKALGDRGDPKFSTLIAVAKALGFRMTVVPTLAEEGGLQPATPASAGAPVRTR